MFRLICVIFCCFYLGLSYGQIDSLTQEELKDWETNLKDKFFDFDNYMINLLDRNGLQKDRRISEIKATYLFAPRASIIDYFPEKIREVHDRESYIERIAEGVKDRYILSRQRKIIGLDDFKIKAGTAIINDDYSTQHRRYEAIVYFHEKLLFSDKVDPKDTSGDPGFIKELHSLKKMKFILRKSSDVDIDYYYDLYCDGLQLVEPEMLDYERLKDSLKYNGSSALYQELLVQENDNTRTGLSKDLLSEEEKNIFEEKEETDGFSTDLRDTLKVTKPVKNSFMDYLLIGKGHVKKGNSGISKGLGIMYGAGVVTGAGLAVYFKLKSRDAYAEHLAANTIVDVDHFYDIANDNHHNFLYALGGSALLAITSTLHLKVKSNLSTKRYNSILDQNEQIKKQKEEMGLELKGFNDNMNTGISLNISF